MTCAAASHRRDAEFTFRKQTLRTRGELPSQLLGSRAAARSAMVSRGSEARPQDFSSRASRSLQATTSSCNDVPVRDSWLRRPVTVDGGATAERRSGGMRPSFLSRPRSLASREMVQLGGGLQLTDTIASSEAVHGYSSFSAGRHEHEAAAGEDGAAHAAAGAAPPLAALAASVRSSGGAKLGLHPAVAKTVSGGILLGGYRGDVGTAYRLDALTAGRSRRRARSGVHPNNHLSNLAAGGHEFSSILGITASQSFASSGLHGPQHPSSFKSDRASVLKVSATLPAEPSSGSNTASTNTKSKPTSFGTVAEYHTKLKGDSAAMARSQAQATATARDRKLYSDCPSHSSVTFGTVVTPGALHRAVPAYVVNVSHGDTIATVKSAGVPIVSRQAYLNESKASGEVLDRSDSNVFQRSASTLDDSLDLPPRRGTGLLSLGLNTPMAQQRPMTGLHFANGRSATGSPQGLREATRSGDNWVRDAQGGIAVGSSSDLVLLDHCELREPRNVRTALEDRNENASSLSLRNSVLSDAALTLLPSLTPFVRTIDLSGSRGFTRAAAAATFAALPNLRCVRLSGCDFLFNADGGVSQACSTDGDALASALVGSSATGRGPGFALVGSLAQLSLEPGRLETFTKQASAASDQQHQSGSPRGGARPTSSFPGTTHIAKGPGEAGLFVVKKRGQRTQVFENVRATNAWVPRVLPAAKASGSAGDAATNRSALTAEAAGVALQPADSVGSDPPAAPPVALLAHAPESAVAAAVSASAATAGGAAAAAGSAVSSDSKDSSLARFAGNGRDMLLQLVRAPRNLHELSLRDCQHLTDDALFTLLKAATSDVETNSQRPFLQLQHQMLEAASGVRIRAYKREQHLSEDETESMKVPTSPASNSEDLEAMNEMRQKMGLKAVTSTNAGNVASQSGKLDSANIPVDRSIEGMLSAMAPAMNLEWQAAVVTAHAQLAKLRSQQQWRQGVGGFADKKETDEDLLQRQISKLAEESNRRPGAKQSTAQDEESAESDSDDEAYIATEDFGPIPHDWFRIKRLANVEAKPSLGTVLPPESALPHASAKAIQAAHGDELLARIPRGGFLDLEVLDLGGCTLLGDSALYFIGAHCPKLTHLSLKGCSQPCLTDRGLFGLTHRGLPRLISLDLSGCTQLTSTAVRAVAFNCPLLEELNLAGCVSLDEKACYAIAYAPCAASLRSTDLTRAEKLTAVPVLRMMQSCPNLSIINLTLCSSITASETNLLAQAVPSVTIIRMPDDAFSKAKGPSLVSKFKAPPREDRFETQAASMMVTRKSSKSTKRRPRG